MATQTATAATANYLIESEAPTRRRRGRVNLCENQGDAWVVVERDISPARAERAGFNRDAPAVQAVFEAAGLEC